MKEHIFNVGDKVLLTSGFSYNHTETITTVTKITPTGRIRVAHSDRLFDSTGHAGGRDVWDSSSSIEPLTKEIIEKLQKKQTIRKCLDLCHSVCNKKIGLTYEQAQQIIDIIETPSQSER